jgi:hypothetical protein
VDLFVATDPDGSGFYGTPGLAPGARCVFEPELLYAPGPPPRELPESAGMVVHENPRDVLHWPGRLWRVRDVDERRWCECHPQERWFRCRELTVVEEVPFWLVFGPRGDQVVTIVQQAGRLTQQQVERIAAMDGSSERELYEKHWDDGTGNSMLPVSRAAEDAAWSCDEALFGYDPESGRHHLADDAWTDARDCAIAAAWGLEQDLYSDAEREVLARRWTSALGTHTCPS